jgi:hypothetical protein
MHAVKRGRADDAGYHISRSWRPESLLNSSGSRNRALGASPYVAFSILGSPSLPVNISLLPVVLWNMF